MHSAAGIGIESVLRRDPFAYIDEKFSSGFDSFLVADWTGSLCRRC